MSLSYVNADSFESALESLKKHVVLFVDLETTGLDPYESTMCDVAICGDALEAYYFPFRHGEGYNLPLSYLNPLRSLLVNRTLVMWNAKFDLKFLIQDKFHINNVEDVMLAAHLMDENERNYKLKDLGQKYISPEATDEQEILSTELEKRGFKDMGDMWNLPAELVAPYAKMDVILTGRLREFYAKLLISYGLYELWQELNEYQIVVLTMEMRGFLMDKEAILREIDIAEDSMQQISTDLSIIMGHPVNPNSPKQISTILGVKSTAVDKIRNLSHPIVKPVIRYRQWTKAKGTYYHSFLDKMRDGILYPNLFMVGTVTGRFSCSKPPLQALPRKLEDKDHPHNRIKSVFIARPEHTLVQIDYRQAEIYLVAHYAKATQLLEMIENDADIHQQTADKVNIPRSAAKRMNFAMQYGIGSKALAEDLNCSIQEASEYILRYNQLHPEIAQLYSNTERYAKINGYIQLFTGRMRRYGHKYRSPYHRASSNLIQGGVAELMRIASTKVYLKMGEYAHQLLHIHDSIFYEIKTIDLEWVIPALMEIMTDFDTYNFKVKFRVDTEIGKNWGDMCPWKGAQQ